MSRLPLNQVVHARQSIHDDPNSIATSAKAPRSTAEDVHSKSNNSSSKDDNSPECSHTTEDSPQQKSFETSGSEPGSPRQTQKKIVVSSQIPTKPKNASKSTIPAPGRAINFILIAIGTIIVICAIVGVYFMPAQNVELRKCTYDELSRRHPIQRDSVWKILSVGIENILNKNSHAPSVYLFVHQGGDTMREMIEDIATHSSACFSNTMPPVRMASDVFTSPRAIQDYGYAIEAYKEKVKNGHVIVIANLNEIPAEVAPALHPICDTHNPIAEDVVLFLTLTTNKTADNVVQLARDTLNDLWGQKLDQDVLDPLITRVTDQVIALQS